VESAAHPPTPEGRTGGHCIGQQSTWPNCITKPMIVRKRYSEHEVSVSIIMQLACVEIFTESVISLGNTLEISDFVKSIILIHLNIKRIEL
jgi:hypothetical protein